MIRKFYNARLKNIVLPEWTALIFIFAVCFFSFGVLLSGLGFFQDDWHHVYYAYWEGAEGLKRFLFIDSRPFAFIVYTFFFKLLGFSPAHWHWTAMLLRLLTTVLVWSAVRQVWPKLADLSAWIALFFAVYPVFPLQSLSVAYALHWSQYAIFMLSMVFMLLAARRPKNYLFLTSLSIILQIFHLVMIEYYAGIELARPFFLWFMFRDFPPRERIKQTLKHWLPYLGVFGLYAVYRLSFSTLFGYDRFTPALIGELATTPLTGMLHLLQTIAQDLTYIMISPWYAAIEPSVFDFSHYATFVMLGVAVIFSLAGYFFLSKLAVNAEESPYSSAVPQVLVLGIIALVVGILPTWILGWSVYSKNPLWSGRLALPAMLGASMIVTGIVYKLIDNLVYRHLVLSILLGVAIGYQVQVARSFHVSWDRQLQFYWQLSWRAPALKPKTLLVSDVEILPYMGYYPTAYAINLLYQQTANPPDYWFNVGSEHINWGTFGQGESVELDRYSSVFKANKRQVVSITFEPGQQQCLWVLRPTYEDVRFLTPEAYTWMSVSNLSLIQPESVSPPPAAIFGAEPEHTWCYFYEKADLASQFTDWQEVIRLWQEASQKGFHPRSSVEFFPFIEAYARLGNWTLAQSLTQKAYVLPPRANSMLCVIWRNIESDTQPSEKRDLIIKDVKDHIRCQESIP